MINILNILVVVSESRDGASAVEVAGRICPAPASEAAVRQVSSRLSSMASRGLLIRHAGHRARYSVTKRGLQELSVLQSASPSVGQGGGG
jgi:hypothetical protein